MRLLLALAAVLMAAATLWYIRRPHDREYVATLYSEDEDGVQPWDVPEMAAA